MVQLLVNDQIYIACRYGDGARVAEGVTRGDLETNCFGKEIQESLIFNISHCRLGSLTTAKVPDSNSDSGYLANGLHGLVLDFRFQGT